jgi:hypothetical protein
MTVNAAGSGVACKVAIAAFLLVFATNARAQTLTDPNPHPNPPPPSGKAAATKHMKSCPEFGAGFYRIDGSNSCVKIGGFVEGGVSSGH